MYKRWHYTFGIPICLPPQVSHASPVGQAVSAPIGITAATGLARILTCLTLPAGHDHRRRERLARRRGVDATVRSWPRRVKRTGYITTDATVIIRA